MDYKASLLIIAQHDKAVSAHKARMSQMQMSKSLEKGNDLVNPRIVGHMEAFAKATGSFGNKAVFAVDMN